MRSFREYMENVVRDYYEKRDIGEDFFTAPELDKAFGIALGEHILSLWDRELTLLELGAGNGTLAHDILSYVKERKPERYKDIRYYIYERSPNLIKRQEERLKDFEGKVFWIEELIPIRGVIFSNEFFDCFPVHVIKEGKELYLDKGSKIWGSLSKRGIVEFLERMGYRQNQVIEVCLDCVEFLKNVAKNLIEGYHIVIDYGYTSEELSKFPEGTLMGYRSHKVVKDLFNEPEPFDLTAMVNFSALMEYGKDFGLESIYFDNLRNFLLSSPSFLMELERLSMSEVPEDVERLSRLKTMLISMGERFKVLIQKKL